MEMNELFNGLELPRCLALWVPDPQLGTNLETSCLPRRIGVCKSPPGLCSSDGPERGTMDGNHAIWMYSRWWFQAFFIFNPNPGEMIQFDEYFSNGLKPPTSICILLGSTRFEGYKNTPQKNGTIDGTNRRHEQNSTMWLRKWETFFTTPAMKWWKVFFQYIPYHRVHTIFFFSNRCFCGFENFGFFVTWSLVLGVSSVFCWT